jgi:hypothetical protein
MSSVVLVILKACLFVSSCSITICIVGPMLIIKKMGENHANRDANTQKMYHCCKLNTFMVPYTIPMKFLDSDITFVSQVHVLAVRFVIHLTYVF